MRLGSILDRTEHQTDSDQWFDDGHCHCPDNEDTFGEFPTGRARQKREEKAANELLLSEQGYRDALDELENVWGIETGHTCTHFFHCPPPLSSHFITVVHDTVDKRKHDIKNNATLDIP